MPKYLIERNVKGVGRSSEEELQQMAEKSRKVLFEMGPEVQWQQSYITGDKIYCVYVAPDEELVREHARRAGFPADHVMPVEAIIDLTTAETRRPKAPAL